MKLIRLYANDSKFKDFTFNESGISIIYAEKTDTKDRNKSYNGVGKSLSLKIIDFCLGSSDKSLEVLEGWIFYLDFRIGNTKYTVSRSTDSVENFVVLNGEEMGVKKYTNFLLAEITSIDSKINFLTFRSLMDRFFKAEALDYSKEPPAVGNENVKSTQVMTAYLLNLNHALALNKIELRTKYSKIDTTRKTISETDDFKKNIRSSTEMDSAVINLELELEELEAKLRTYKLAKDYDDIKKEYEQFRIKLNDLISERVVKETMKSRVEADSKLKSEISSEEVHSFYEDVGLIFGDSIKKNIDEVSGFHKILTQNRQIRLVEQKVYLNKKISKLNKEIEVAQSGIDESYKKLSGSISFKEYESMMHKIVSIKEQINSIQSKSELLRSYENSMSQIETDMQTDNTTAREVLNKNLKWKQEIERCFIKYSKSIYPEASASLNIIVDEGRNLTRYKYIPEIESDQAGGISKAKILIFDLMLMTLGKHKIKFLVHDNYIFLEMDKRQCANALLLIEDLCKELDFQYIFAINHDDLNAIKMNLEQEELHVVSDDKIVLRLNDKGDEGKLLGAKYNIKKEVLKKKTSKQKES
ncbi:DUF2326 domain-containing protein [Gottschalkiaceae bacterium SANA]|nr:DUF2326 domain-containing protein [Gottschalkiaceae bacterium SANA]